jgi:hypothetical protein
MTETTAPHSTIRTVAAITSMFVPLAAVIGSFLLWKDELPSELASHWSGTGPADGVMTVQQFLTLALVATGAAAVAGLVLGAWPGIRDTARRYGFLLAGFVAGAGAQSWLVSAFLTMRAGDPYEVVQGAWSVLGFVAIGYGLIPFFLAPKPQLLPHDVDERIDLGSSESGAWSRTVTARLFLWTAAALLAAAVAIYVTAAASGTLAGAMFGLVVLAVIVVALASMSRYRVTADWRGLRVVSSLSGIPLKRIRLEDIRAVEAAELVPKEWGGWGYRITPGRSAMILRKGPGLIVTTTNAKQFAVTVDGPELPTALLATLRDRRFPVSAAGAGNNA